MRFSASESPSVRMRAGRSFRIFAGRQAAAHGLGQPAENDRGHTSAQLLVYNRFHQRFEIRVAELDAIISNAVNDFREHRIVAPEVLNGFFHIETDFRRDTSPIVPACDYFSFSPSAPCSWRKLPAPADNFPTTCPPSRWTSTWSAFWPPSATRRARWCPTSSKKDFTILEDGKPQPIKYFTRETDLPLTIGLLIDVSGSQRNLIQIERDAASQFFTQVLRKKDEAFLHQLRRRGRTVAGLHQLRPSC